MRRTGKTRKGRFDSGEHKKVWETTRLIADELRDQETIESSEVAHRVMRKLRLPTDNPTAVWMMFYCGVQIAGQVLRYYFARITETDKAQGTLGPEFSPEVQDRYSVLRNGRWRYTLRGKLTAAELQAIIKKLLAIGGRYRDHALALRKEMVERFPESVAS